MCLSICKALRTGHTVGLVAVTIIGQGMVRVGGVWAKPRRPCRIRIGGAPSSAPKRLGLCSGNQARCPGDILLLRHTWVGRGQRPTLTSAFKARCSAAAEGGAGRLPPRPHPCPWSLRTVRRERSQAEREDPAPPGPGPGERGAY